MPLLEDSRGFRHRGDQLKQAPPISAGKGPMSRGAFPNRASEIQPCKSLMAEKWSWYGNLLNERNSWLISQSYTSGDQREKETWQPCASTLECQIQQQDWGSRCFSFSVWMKMSRFMLKLKKKKACRGLYGGKMLAKTYFYYNFPNVLRYNWTTTQNIKLLIL